MRVTEQTIDAYCFCQALLPVPGTRSRKRCQGYEPTPAVVIKTTRTEFFGDNTAGSGATDIDLVMADRVSHENEYLRFAADADRQCPHCGQWTREPMLADHHPVYDHLSDQDPDRLLELDDAARRAALAQADQAESLQALVLTMREQSETQATAIAAQAQQNAELMAQNRALMERLVDGLYPEKPAPAARRKS